MDYVSWVVRCGIQAKLLAKAIPMRGKYRSGIWIWFSLVELLHQVLGSLNLLRRSKKLNVRNGSLELAFLVLGWRFSDACVFQISVSLYEVANNYITTFCLPVALTVDGPANHNDERRH